VDIPIYFIKNLPDQIIDGKDDAMKAKSMEYAAPRIP
jgi:hypothetical protein